MEPDRIEMNTGTLRNSKTNSIAVEIRIILVSIYASSFPVSSRYVLMQVWTAMVTQPTGSGI